MTRRQWPPPPPGYPVRGMGQPQDFAAELAQVRQMAEYAAGAARRAEEVMAMQGPAALEQVRRDHELVMTHLSDLSNVLQAMRFDRIGGGNGSPDIQRIEQIPGRRVPFNELVEVPIANNDTSIRTGTITISQEGPFVAVARYATFLSQFSFQFTDPETASVATFLGRSNGRFRPIHSAADMLDALLPGDVTRAVAFPGTGGPSYSSPALHAPFRTMEFDGRIEIRDQGSSWPRSNIPVPSPFWTTFINSPFQLGALDFFARGEVIEFRIQPQHVNNPRAGNIIAIGAGGVFPFSDAQFDHHEGINDTEDLTVTTDPVTRLPNGTLIIGMHGYRIIQPPGAVVQPGSI